MPVVSLHGMSFSGVPWTFKLLLSKQTQTGTWHAMPLAGTFQRPACGLAVNLRTKVSWHDNVEVVDW